MMGRRIRLAVAAAGLLWIGATPGAAAGVDGPCTAFFNGVAVADIDDLTSPLLLQFDDVLVFQGTDDTGTTAASVEVILASITVDSASTDFGPVQNGFSVELELAEMSPYTVGLFRIRGITDNCTADAWVRVTGRFPFTTLAGITAGGLALGGLAGQLTSIATRRRWSPSAAGLSGIATGLGGALLGQQFGRLQLSYVSIGISIAVAALIGVIIALLLRPRAASGWTTRRRAGPSEKRRARRRAPAEDEIPWRVMEAERIGEIPRTDDAHRARAGAVAAGEVTPTGPVSSKESVAAADSVAREEAEVQETAQLEAEPAATRQTEEPVAALQTTPEAEGPAWCYVMGPVDVVDLTDHTRVVGTLTPGTWYLAKRQVGSWVHIVVGEGTEGWAPASSIHRQG